MMNSTSCLSSMMLVRGSTEKVEMRTVAPAYATSGQKKRGTEKTVFSRTITATQHTSISDSRICAYAMEIWSNATKQSSSAKVTRSRPGAVRGCVMLIVAVVSGV